jgi:hypothetical protein
LERLPPVTNVNVHATSSGYLPRAGSGRAGRAGQGRAGQGRAGQGRAVQAVHHHAALAVPRPVIGEHMREHEGREPPRTSREKEMEQISDIQNCELQKTLVKLFKYSSSARALKEEGQNECEHMVLFERLA